MACTDTIVADIVEDNLSDCSDDDSDRDDTEINNVQSNKSDLKFTEFYLSNLQVKNLIVQVKSSSY